MTVNVGTVNMILLMLITVVKVFLTNLVTKPNVGDVVRWTISMEPRGPRPGPLGRGSNAVKVLYPTLLRDCGVFIFNLLYYSKNAAPLRAGGLAL